jgi:hypothetical protein
MPRPYGDKYLLWLFDQQELSFELRFAKACVNANLPMKYVAAALDANHMTVYRWFRGSKIRSEERRKVVEAFVRLLAKDTADGLLPVRSVKAAKHYIETMIGRSI